MKIRLIVLIVFFLAAGRLGAQRPGNGIWLSMQLPVILGKNWQWHHDLGYRTEGISIHPAQVLYRTGARYRLGKDLTVAAGVAGFFTKRLLVADDGAFGKEFRFWQELSYSRERQSRFQWQCRVRTEQRFFSSTKTKPGAHANRFRFRFGMTEKIRGSWSLQVADEWMQQQKSGSFSFDQNRVMLNILKKGRGLSQWALGYMWLKWPDESQHIMTVSYQQTIRFHGN